LICEKAPHNDPRGNLAQYAAILVFGGAHMSNGVRSAMTSIVAMVAAGISFPCQAEGNSTPRRPSMVFSA
jgi:hypothetical protein